MIRTEPYVAKVAGIAGLNDIRWTVANCWMAWDHAKKSYDYKFDLECEPGDFIRYWKGNQWHYEIAGDSTGWHTTDVCEFLTKVQGGKTS